MKIALITSGGDAPGMNACLRAIVRYALSNQIEVFGFYRGFKGILEDDLIKLDRKSVSNIIQQGGTFLKSDRCENFKNKETRIKASEILKSHEIDVLIGIGGDGTFSGLKLLNEDTGINVIGIPGTIDNDQAYTDYTLGFDTAVNNVLWAINNLRDTMHSHNKITFVEVMGRHCGDIALHAGLAGGAEYILVPELKYDIKEIAEEVKKSASLGKRSNLVVFAEGAGKMADVCQEFEKYSGIVPRQTQLGFIQRGGTPTHFDRLLACEFGIQAVKCALNNETNVAVGIKGGRIFSTPICDAVKIEKKFDIDLYNDIQKLI